MSQRRRLPNSFKVARQLDGWKWDCREADAACRRLNVSRSVVQRLWDQYQSEDSVSRRPVPGRPRATTPAEDRFLALSARRRRTTTVPQLVCRPLSSIRKKNLRYYGAKSSSQCRSVCKKTSCVRSLNGRQRRNRLCWAREHVSWTLATMGFCAVHTDESRFTMES
ncbi:paired domain-containing protein [Trichonephila clavipes]|nr:paired domain-containing protein [Trichonephila clavipes]